MRTDIEQKKQSGSCGVLDKCYLDDSLGSGFSANKSPASPFFNTG